MAGSINVTFKVSVQEANLIADALQAYRRVQVFNSKAVAATPEERMEGATAVFACEGILRQMGYEPIDLTKQDTDTKVDA